ncbi:hypothetical protein M0Q50_10640 [bacterium]|jgi:hypothetical protein|nr:hypothetical protein [bacterium]
MNKESWIIVGNIYLSSWKHGDKLYQDWMLKYPEDYAESINSDPNEIVIDKEGEYTLIVDYPLNNIYQEKFLIDKNGLKRIELVEKIVNTYKYIYDNIDIYKIWGHNLSDLILHTIYVKENNIIKLGIDS